MLSKPTTFYISEKTIIIYVTQITKIQPFHLGIIHKYVHFVIQFST